MSDLRGMLCVVGRGRADLLSKIETAALDPTSDLPSLLRMCVSLGGVTGSESLRSWATRELKGYGPDDELPPYREVVAPLLLDGVTGYTRITGQMVPVTMIPDFARGEITTDVTFRQPIAEIAGILAAVRRQDEDTIRISPPGARELVALINSDLAKHDQRQYPGTDLPPRQVVERIYWSVNVAPIDRILDVVRTTLVELVAEMRAGTPVGQDTPPREVAEQAVGVAIHGKRNRVVINQVGPSDNAVAAAGGSASVGEVEFETPQRKVMWWLVGCATIVAAIAAIWLLFL